MRAPFSFDQAIAPQTPETFFSEYFEKKPMVIKRGKPDYFTSLLTYAEIDRVLTTMGLHHPEVNVTRTDQSITPTDFTQDNGRIDPIRVTQLFDDGATVILSGLQERLPNLADFCRAMEAVMSARVQTNIYITPPGSQGLNPHYDSHDVLVLQVAGSKEWRIFGTPIEVPLPDQAFERGMDIGAEVERFVLEPGDTLYVPRGVAHDAVATDDASLHITTGLMFRTWADMLVDGVIAMAHRDPAMRRALPPGFANHGADLDALAATYMEHVGKLTDLPVDKLVHRAREDFLSARPPLVAGQMAQLAALETLTMDSRIGARPHLVYALTHDTEDGKVRLSCYGSEIVMPDFATIAMEFCLTTPDFRLADMEGKLDDAGKLALAKRLIREGLMQVL